MISLFRPTYAVESFGHISPELLMAQHPDIKGLSHDIDGYLLNYEGLIIPPAHLDVIKEASSLGFLQAIITNAEEGKRLERAEKIVDKIKDAAELDDLPLVASSMPGHRKKPDSSMFEAAAAELGLDNEQMCHGGDQLLKDIYGANKAGYGATILTRRFGYSDHPGVRFVQRPIEAVVRPIARVSFADSL